MNNKKLIEVTRIDRVVFNHNKELSELMASLAKITKLKESRNLIKSEILLETDNYELIIANLKYCCNYGTDFEILKLKFNLTDD